MPANVTVPLSAVIQLLLLGNESVVFWEATLRQASFSFWLHDLPVSQSSLRKLLQLTRHFQRQNGAVGWSILTDPPHLGTARGQTGTVAAQSIFPSVQDLDGTTCPAACPGAAQHHPLPSLRPALGIPSVATRHAGTYPPPRGTVSPNVTYLRARFYCLGSGNTERPEPRGAARPTGRCHGTAQGGPGPAEPGGTGLRAAPRSLRALSRAHPEEPGRAALIGGDLPLPSAPHSAPRATPAAGGAPRRERGPARPRPAGPAGQRLGARLPPPPAAARARPRRPDRAAESPRPRGGAEAREGGRNAAAAEFRLSSHGRVASPRQPRSDMGLLRAGGLRQRVPAAVSTQPGPAALSRRRRPGRRGSEACRAGGLASRPPPAAAGGGGRPWRGAPGPTPPCKRGRRPSRGCGGRGEPGWGCAGRGWRGDEAWPGPAGSGQPSAPVPAV